MTDRISEYTTIAAKRGTDLDAQVNAAIKNGWQPIGGVVIHNDSEKFIWAQAMVKYASQSFLDGVMGSMKK